MIQGCPFSAVTNLDRREENGMEIDIVLAHELIQADILVVEPPLLPLRCVVRGDTGIADAGFKLAPCHELVSLKCELALHTQTSETASVIVVATLDGI